MSQVTIKYDSKKTNDKSGNEIPSGTYFTGQIGGHDAVLFLKYAGDRIIALNDPKELYWTGNPTVKNYREVDVEIHVKEQK